MEFIKSLLFGIVFLLTLTGSNCFVVSNFDTSDDDDDEDRNRGGLIIGITNGVDVSRIVMQSLAQTVVVADVASESIQYTNDSYLPEPKTFKCGNSSGEIISTIYDLDSSKTLSSGDKFLIDYANCSLNEDIINGSLQIFVLDADGVGICTFSSGTDWNIYIRAITDNVEIVSEDDLFEITGNLEIELKYIASTALLEKKISNNNLVITSQLQTQISQSYITQLINHAVAPTNYLLSVDNHQVFIDEENGYVDINAEKITGMNKSITTGCYNPISSPISGAVEVIGKDSVARIQIMPDNQVNIDIDSNGDNITDHVIFSNLPVLN